MAILEVSALVGGYGEVTILNGVSLRCEEDEIVAIIGPNGAGKSTLMKSIFGLVAIRSGGVRFEGKDITGGRPSRLVRMGMSYVPQEKNIFPSLTVEENLQMGAFVRTGRIESAMAQVFDLFPFIAERRKTLSGNLSGGGRQMLALGRALMLDPLKDRVKGSSLLAPVVHWPSC